MHKVSIFANAKETKTTHELYLEQVFEYIKEGRWQDLVLNYRNTKDIEVKKLLPCFTASGTFKERNTQGLKEHSNVICIDVDEVNLEEKNNLVNKLKKDSYTLALHDSCGGIGLAVYFRIKPTKHLESFLTLEKYFFENYGIVIDRKCKDVSRLRFVSFDPELYYNPDCKLWDKEPPKQKKKPTNLPQIFFADNDIAYILQQIRQGNVNICSNYEEWLEVGFALASEFGEVGREYFHLISDISSNYRSDSQAANSKLVDRQYDSCLKARGTGITIATFFWLCKNNGIDLQTEQTKIIVEVARQGKKGKRKPEAVIDSLEKMQSIPRSESEKLIEKVYESNEQAKDLSIYAKVALWLNTVYDLKFNEATNKVELDNIPITDFDINTMFMNAKDEVGDKIGYQDFGRLLYSDRIKRYNPIEDFFNKNKKRKPEGTIKKVVSLLETDSGFGYGDFDTEYTEYFFTKWLVSMIAGYYGNPQPLVFVLSGEQMGTGKTTFFENLLPIELETFFATCNFERGKDDEIIMTEKLLILSDELAGGLMKTDEKFKSLTSAKKFTLRRPFGKLNEDVKRIASLCGTANEIEILSDPFGNRRIIPVHIVGNMDINKYLSIDKSDLLMEAYNLYQNGYQYWLSTDDVARLNKATKLHDKAIPEAELLTKFFIIPDKDNVNLAENMTTTEITDYISRNISAKINISVNKMGRQLKRLGFKQEINNKGRFYQVIKKY